MVEGKEWEKGANILLFLEKIERFFGESRFISCKETKVLVTVAKMENCGKHYFSSVDDQNPFLFFWTKINLGATAKTIRSVWKFAPRHWWLGDSGTRLGVVG